MKLKLTRYQIETFAKKIFTESFSEGNYNPEWDDCDSFIKNDWIGAACDMIDNYNCVVRHIDFPGVTIVKNCCLICRHVDLYRPACNLRGDDILLSCCCSHFELFEFEEEDE